jgi:hypothetical protein
MNATFYVFLFSSSLLATYALVRLGWVRVASAFLVGSILNSAFFFMYSIARGNALVHAITVGVLLGIVFSGLSVAMAAYFKESLTVTTKAPTTVTAGLNESSAETR